MAFKKINVAEEIEKRVNENEEFKNSYIESQLELELIKQIIHFRNQMGISQKAIAEKSGLTQQMVSRIETAGHSPNLRNFLKYIDSLGLEIKIEKRHEEDTKHAV
jgi:DNA-binding XRE family transcriptional regulator